MTDVHATIATMAEALRKASKQFRGYAHAHLDKAERAPSNSDEYIDRTTKADTNNAFADMCDAALSTTSQAESVRAVPDLRNFIDQAIIDKLDSIAGKVEKKRLVLIDKDDRVVEAPDLGFDLAYIAKAVALLRPGQAARPLCRRQGLMSPSLPDGPKQACGCPRVHVGEQGHTCTVHDEKGRRWDAYTAVEVAALNRVKVEAQTAETDWSCYCGRHGREGDDQVMPIGTPCWWRRTSYEEDEWECGCLESLRDEWLACAQTDWTAMSLELYQGRKAPS